MLANALSIEYGLGVDVKLSNSYSIVPNDAIAKMDGQPDFKFQDKIPYVQMSHKRFGPEFLDDKRLVFMTRDPRDIMVSHWMHDKNQVHLFKGSLSEFVYSRNHGIAKFLSHVESWAPHLDQEKVITYESMKADTVDALSRVGNLLSVPLSGKTIASAVTLGGIDRMREIEIKNGIAGQHYDQLNPDARRVRVGQIGGFINHLSKKDLTYIDNAVMDASTEAQSVIGLTPYFDKP